MSSYAGASIGYSTIINDPEDEQNNRETDAITVLDDAYHIYCTTARCTMHDARFQGSVGYQVPRCMISVR